MSRKPKQFATSRRKSRSCPRCRHTGIGYSSASPGDGRRQMWCQKCRFTWTDGKVGGYK